MIMIILKSFLPNSPANRVTPTTNKKNIANREIAQMNIRGNYATELAKTKSSTTATAAVGGIRTEADEYFEQLKKSWEIAEKRKK
jgi:ribosome-associated toxin RatA of RatAB toxin-antitoxin module